MVRAIFRDRYPDDPVPDFPDGGDPNGAIMVIDQMLARLEGREPTRIRTGTPYVPEDGDAK